MQPLTPNALGTAKELLAVLSAVRDQGWCLLDQELEVGLISVAAPVFDGPKVVAALNVSLQAQSLVAEADPEAFLDTLTHEVVTAAKLVSKRVSTPH